MGIGQRGFAVIGGAVEEWSLPVDAAALQDMRRRLNDRRRPKVARPGWTEGIEADYLDRLCDHLAGPYRWSDDIQRFAEQHLMVRARSTGHRLHVTLPAGKVEGATPLVLLYGWPSCSFEFVHVAGHLVAQGMYPVLIDLPGFGFSDAPVEPMGPRSMAACIAEVLGDGLGLGNVIVHGNDWGSTVACWLTIDFPRTVTAIHLSMMGMRPRFDGASTPPGDIEQQWIKVVQKRLAADAGYREIQATRPNTASAALADSPAGLAAWIAEKFHGWTTEQSVENPLVRMDDLAAIITAYWLTGSIASANWVYTAGRRSDDTVAPPGGTGSTPVGFSFFGGGFFPPPPRSWAERLHHVQDFRIHASGGHYPALTNPGALAEDLVAFCEQLD